MAMRKILPLILIATTVASIVWAGGTFRENHEVHVINNGSRVCLVRVTDGIEIFVPSGHSNVREANIIVNLAPSYTTSLDIRPGVTQIKRDKLRDQYGRPMESGILIGGASISFKDDQFSCDAFSWVGSSAQSSIFPIACLARTPDGIEAFVPTGVLPGQASIQVNGIYTNTVDLSNGINAMARSGFRDSEGKQIPDGVSFLTAKVMCMPSGATGFVDWNK
jgi:hypothetical protein